MSASQRLENMEEICILSGILLQPPVFEDKFVKLCAAPPSQMHYSDLLHCLLLAMEEQEENDLTTLTYIYA